MKELIEKLKTCRLMYRNDICHLLLNTEEMNIIIQALSLKEASKDTSESDKELQALTSVKSESAEEVLNKIKGTMHYNGFDWINKIDVLKAMHDFANADKKQHAKILENTYIKCMVEELINRHRSSFVELDIPTDYKKQILYELGISPNILDY